MSTRSLGSGKTSRITVYADIYKQKPFVAGDIVYCDAEVDPESRKPIKIFIDTVGGDVQVMWTLINAMKISQTPIYTIVYCTALSAGAHILAAGHKRFAFPGSTILVHSGSRQYTGDAEKVESTKMNTDLLPWPPK